MTTVEKSSYQTELLSLLRTSTLTPGTYKPSSGVIASTHAAVLVGGVPVILCGPANDRKSVEQASALATSRWFEAGARTAGYQGEITAGMISGAMVTWNATMTAIVEKVSGDTEVGDGPLIAIVLNDPTKAFATYLCVTTETARALDPNAPVLDAGNLCELARASLPILH